MNNAYRLVGYLNYFGVYPDTIYPIFVDKNNNMYWAFSDTDDSFCVYYYTRFLKLPDKYADLVKYFNDTNTELDISDKYFHLGDLMVGGIELSKNRAYIGTIDKYYDFISRYIERYKKRSKSKNKNIVIELLTKDAIEAEKLVRQAKIAGVLEKNK